jgi:Predicted periplasmic protein (DUF2092)
MRQDNLDSGAKHVPPKGQRGLRVSLAFVAGGWSRRSIPSFLGADGQPRSANEFSFQSRTFRSYAGPNGELLHIAHTTKTISRRPDRLSTSVTDDDDSIKVLYDGKALVLYAIGVKQYVSLPVTGVLTSHLIFWKSAPELVFHSPIY